MFLAHTILCSTDSFAPCWIGCPDGSSKTYHVYQSDKLYWKRRLNGRLSNGGAKYFYVSAETALLVLLINLARVIAFCDMQASLNGMPSNKISLVVNFVSNYVEQWCTACQDLSVFLLRFHLYADAIVAKGSRIGVVNMHCRIVAFTDGTLIPTCRPHGNGNSATRPAISLNSSASTNLMTANFSASLILMASFSCMDHSEVRATMGRYFWRP